MNEKSKTTLPGLHIFSYVTSTDIRGGGPLHISLWVMDGCPFDYRNERKLAVMNTFPSSFLICWKGLDGVAGVDRC